MIEDVRKMRATAVQRVRERFAAEGSVLRREGA